MVNEIFFSFLILDIREDYEIYLCNIYIYMNKSIINKKIIWKKRGKKRKIVKGISEKNFIVEDEGVTVEKFQFGNAAD